MPSPFPGMDPFLEGDDWEDFHTRMITALSDSVAPSIQPEYLVRVERRVYIEYDDDEDNRTPSRQPDIAIIAVESGLATGLSTSSDSDAVATECELPMPIEHREAYLVIRERESMEVVTVIELLSPANKKSNSIGRREYLQKRQQYISSCSHLVELDLLRGGQRLPVIGSLPPGDYYAIISRSYRLPKGEVYSWTLQQRLPTIPIPLKQGDDDVMLELQSVFATVYDRARYDLSIDYTSEPTPALTAEQRNLIQ